MADSGRTSDNREGSILPLQRQDDYPLAEAGPQQMDAVAGPKGEGFA